MPEESTTPAGVELMRLALGASRRRDYEAIMELFAPDAVWESLDGLGVFEGSAAVRGFIEDFPSAYDSFESEPEELVEMGGGVTFVVIRHRGALQGASGRVEQRFAWVVAIERGLIARVLAGIDVAGARAAAERLAAGRGQAMAQENAEIVQAAFRSFEQGDIEGVLRSCDESIEITQSAELLGVPLHQHGHAGVREAFGIWPQQWDDFRLDLVRVVAVGDRVLVTTIQHGRGKGSGIEVEMPFAFVFALRDGKIVEWLIFTREGEALEAVGLAE